MNCIKVKYNLDAAGRTNGRQKPKELLCNATILLKIIKQRFVVAT